MSCTKIMSLIFSSDAPFSRYLRFCVSWTRTKSTFSTITRKPLVIEPWNKHHWIPLDELHKNDTGAFLRPMHRFLVIWDFVFFWTDTKSTFSIITRKLLVLGTWNKNHWIPLDELCKNDVSLFSVRCTVFEIFAFLWVFYPSALRPEGYCRRLCPSAVCRAVCYPSLSAR